RLAVLVPAQRTDIDSFVKARVNNPGLCFYRIADETILAAFPRIRFLAVKIALDVLIKIRPVAAENGVVVRGQDKIESRPFILSACRGPKSENDDYRQKRPARHRFFFSPISGQSFFIESISALVKPDAM